MDIHYQLQQALEKIEQLKKENIALKKENRTLKDQLLNVNKETSTYNNPKVTAQSAKEEKLSLFMNLFRGRTDVFAQKRISKNGKPAFYPVKASFSNYSDPNVSYHPLTESIIIDHLKGKKIIGVYPLLENNTCSFLAVDFDKKEWKRDVLIFAETCEKFRVPYHIERSQSGNGAHVWFFFEKPVAASLARKFGNVLLSKSTDKRLEIGLDSYDRMFPSQDNLSIGGLGNLIALPFQDAARLKENSVFVNKSFEVYDDQWAYLSTIEKVAEQEIKQIAAQYKNNYPVINETNNDVNHPLPQEIKIELKNGIHILRKNIPNHFLLEMQRLATFGNPEYFKAKAKRYSTHRIPKQIDCSIVTDEELILPRGTLNEVEKLASSKDIQLTFIDSRDQEIHLKFNLWVN